MVAIETGYSAVSNGRVEMRGGVNNRDPRVEQWLDREQVRWRYVQDVALSRIDRKRSRENRGRVGKPLDESRAEMMALAIIDGSRLPAAVAFRAATGYVYISGNHRDAAALLAELETVDLYVVDEHDPVRLDHLTRAANIIEGQGAGPEEALEQAISLHQRHGTPLVALERQFGVKARTIGHHVQSRATAKRLDALKIDHRKLGVMTLNRLGAIPTDRALAEAARLTRAAGLGSEQVSALVREVRKARSEDEQVAVVNDWRRREEITDRIAQTRNGVLGPPRAGRAQSPRSQMLVHLGGLARALERAGSPADLGLDTEAGCAAIRETWGPIAARLTQWLGDGR